ncbi:MAG TPA: glycosyltransferase family 39 protein [Sphingomonas sp.]
MRRLPAPPLYRSHAAQFIALAIILAELSLFFHPAGFAGGPSDDQRYLDIALGWYAHGPQIGTSHWALRHPLILSVTGIFELFGPSIDSLLLVPRLFYALFVGVTMATVVRLAGPRAAMVWLALVILSPVLHAMGTSCYPEMLELAFSATSIWAFLHARRSTGASLSWALLSGLMLGCAVLTRETAAFVLLFYGWAFLRDPGMPRRTYLWLGLGFALPLLVDNVWLWAVTGDPLYRLHVDQHHVLIASDHMVGKTYAGSPFLNPDLASRWIPAGPTRLHWIVNPLGDFLIDPAFGFVILGWTLSALPLFRDRAIARPKIAPLLLLLFAIASYVTVTWVFTLRPQPRYYLFVVAAATIGFALYMDSALSIPRLRRRASILLGLILLGGGITIAVAPDQGWQAKLVVPYMAAHPGQYSAEDHIVGRASYPLARLGMAGKLTTAEPAVGAYRFRLIDSAMLDGSEPFPHDPAYREIAYLERPTPWLLLLIRPHYRNPILVEQRLR